MILCECGELIKGNNCTFKDYIPTLANPSTPTTGHKKCGCIFNFIDEKRFSKYSSKTELKSLAMKFAEKNNLDTELVGRFLLDVDRLKSSGKSSDNSILITAYLKVEK